MNAGWRPIEAAPKDKEILLHVEVTVGPMLVVQGCWFSVSQEDEGWIDTLTGDVWTPTHWMPLPAPPTKEQA